MSLFRPYEIGNPQAPGESSPLSGHGSPSPPPPPPPQPGMPHMTAAAAAAAAAMFANDIIRSKLIGHSRRNEESIAEEENEAGRRDKHEEEEEVDIDVEEEEKWAWLLNLLFLLMPKNSLTPYPWR